MTIRKSIQSYFWFLLAVILVACQSPATPDTTTFTPVVVTQIVPLSDLPTPTISSEPTALPDVLPKFPLDGYVVLFTKDGDLYFQDGENMPVKLTHVGESFYYPKLSDDNQKVIFFREDFNKIYSINTDGSQEQIIISNDRLASFETGTNISVLNFTPGSHQLFFKTHLCKSQEDNSTCSSSIFLANTDTGEIKKLADLGLISQKNIFSRNLEVSPDGKMVAVGTTNGMDILDLDGNTIRHDILPYTPSMSDVIFPWLFWLPDSSGLIVTLPNIVYRSSAWGNVPAYTVWRYTIDGDVTVQIPLDPPLMGEGHFGISPDGNWAIYGGISNAEPETSLYIGNLTNGQTQIYGNGLQPTFSWSSDSEHFIYTSTGQSTLGTIGTPPIPLEACGFIQWIDAAHFTCRIDEEGHPPRTRMAEINAEAIKIYDLGFDKDIERFVFIKPK